MTSSDIDSTEKTVKSPHRLQYQKPLYNIDEIPTYYVVSSQICPETDDSI